MSTNRVIAVGKVGGDSGQREQNSGERCDTGLIREHGDVVVGGVATSTIEQKTRMLWQRMLRYDTNTDTLIEFENEGQINNAGYFI